MTNIHETIQALKRGEPIKFLLNPIYLDKTVYTFVADPEEGSSLGQVTWEPEGYAPYLKDSAIGFIVSREWLPVS